MERIKKFIDRIQASYLAEMKIQEKYRKASSKNTGKYRTKYRTEEKNTGQFNPLKDQFLSHSQANLPSIINPKGFD